MPPPAALRLPGPLQRPIRMPLYPRIPVSFLAGWIIHVPKPLLISVEAAASLRYEPAVMWLYRDQSSLYPTSQSHILYSLPETLWCLPPPLPLCSIFQSLPLSPLLSLSVSVNCVLLPLSNFIRTDTLYLLLTGFLFSPSNIAIPFFLPLQPLAVKQKPSPTYLWSPFSTSIFSTTHSLF